jgi:outer membrane immunogenic protein
MKSFAASLLIVLGLGAASAHAQASSTASQLSFDVAGGFTVIHANEGPGVCGCFFMNGGSGEFSIKNTRNISFVTNAGYTTITNINNIDRNLALLTVLEGVRYSRDHGGRFIPFGQAMVGIAHTYTNYRIDSSTTRAAAAAGGGLDIRINDRFALRPAEVEYLFTSVPNGQNNFQNQLRMTAGVVFHISKQGR